MTSARFTAFLATTVLALTGCAVDRTPPAELSAAVAPVTEPALEVRVDPRIELMMIIFRLAGSREFAGSNARYAEAIDKHFKPFAGHPAVAMAKRLSADYGVSYNAVPELAIMVGSLPLLAEEVPLERQPNLDERWTPERARTFLALAREFAADSNAAAFFAAQRSLYAVLERRMTNLIAQEADLQWIRDFYGDSGGDRFIVTPSMLAGGGNYGPAYQRADGRRDLYAVLGIGSSDEDGNPVVSVGHASLLVHEFGHSFVNPLILAHRSELTPVSAALKAQARDAMDTIGYRSDVVVLYDTIIRAGVARYKLAHGGPEIAERELDRQRKFGFVWIDDFYHLLGRYEADRVRYPTFAAFYPVLKAHLDTLPPRLPAMTAAYDARRPKIVDMTPRLDAGPIDPRTKQIRLRFDRPMAERWGFNMNVAQSLPTVTGIRLEDGDRLMVIGVELEPGKSYDMPFFAAGDNAPRSKADGTILAATTLRFTTKSAPRTRR